MVSRACQQWLSLAAEAIPIDPILNVRLEAIMTALHRILARPVLVKSCTSLCTRYWPSFLECLHLCRVSPKLCSFLLSLTAAHCRQKPDCAQGANSHTQ